MAEVCDRVTERVNLFLDRELDEAEADEIRRHIMECEHCSDELDVWLLIRHLVKRAYRPDTAPVALLRRITQQIHQAHQAEQGSADEASETGTPPAGPAEAQTVSL
ncbi:MAG: zf-HC2 domain-containing protein [Propionibacteriaceae bacterium]|jgi:anti-sigma factor (TIGR02949 family)|nr:zf-HC2 domain-containing protein [Propionibacteriaceae bacterium]